MTRRRCRENLPGKAYRHGPWERGALVFSRWPPRAESASILCHDPGGAEAQGVRGDRSPRRGDHRSRRAHRHAAEMGFKEVKTARLVRETLAGLGLTPRTGLAMTGVRADARGRAGDGPTFALIGELDGLRVTGHPRGRSRDGGGARLRPQRPGGGHARARPWDWSTPRRFDHLAGRIAFFAVPAEEGGDIEWRQGQIRAGRAGVPVRQAGADPPRPLRRRGPRHDDPHELARARTARQACPRPTTAGWERPRASRARRARGRSAPPRDQRALRCAGRAGRDQRGPRDVPRRGFDPRAPDPDPRRLAGERDPRRGAPRDVRARARAPRAWRTRARRVDRALRAGALALGAQVEIETLPGPMPLLCDRVDGAALRDGGPRPGGRRALPRIPHRSGSTDMGDLSQMMPGPASVHGRSPGAGALRGVRDRRRAARLRPAGQGLGRMAMDLLADGAAGAREVLARPRRP